MSPNMQMRLKPETLARYNLPDIPWPLPIAAFAAAVSEPAELPLAEMLFALQNQSDDEPSIWKSLEPAMNRLSELVSEDLKAFPPDDQLLAIGSETWWLELGPVDLTKKLIAILRSDEIVAAVCPREDGRLRIAVYRPLDSSSLSKLLAASIHPDPEYGVCMRPNNWEYLVDASFGMGNSLASLEERPCLQLFPDQNEAPSDEPTPEWRTDTRPLPRPLPVVAAEIGVYYTLSNEAGSETK